VPTFNTNDVTLYYERAGEGAPVIFVHGGFANLRMAMSELKPYDWTWEADFASRFDFVWYDRRGCYRSSRPKDGYDLDKQVSDLEQLLDHLGLKSAHLIGSSAGGPIEMLFAAARPERVRSLVLAGTGLELFPADDPITPIIREQLQILRQLGSEAAFDKRPDPVEVSLDVLWEIEEEKVRGTLATYLAHQRKLAEQAKQFSRAERMEWYAAELSNIGAYMDFHLEPCAKQIRQPTMILHGSNDKVVPLTWGMRLARSISDSVVEVVQDGSHSLIMRDPNARQQAIQFVEQAESQYRQTA
jgi:3-oxoadipate enol-lactonase